MHNMDFNIFKMVYGIDKIKDIYQRIFTNYMCDLLFLAFNIMDAIVDPTLRFQIFEIARKEDFGRSQKEAEANTALYLIIYQIILNVPAIIFGPSCGVWSDRFGEKRLILLCFFCQAIACSVFGMSLFMTPRLSLLIVFLGAMIRGCFGKSAISLAVHSYVGRMSSTHERTRRYGLLLAMDYIGKSCGSLLAGLLLNVDINKLGNPLIFNIVLSLICALISMHSLEAKTINKDTSYNDPNGGDTTATMKTQTLTTFFKWNNCKESFSVLLTQREYLMRYELMTLFVMFFIVQLCKAGEIDVQFLFLQSKPFNWPEPVYGYMLAIDYAVMGFVQIVLLPVAVNQLQFTDTSLIICGLIFKIVRLIILPFCWKTWHIFIICVIGSPYSFVATSLRSIISKIVCDDDLGKIFSLLSWKDSFGYLIGPLVLNHTYSATAHILFPGFVFLIDACVHICLVFVITILRTSRNCNNVSNNRGQETVDENVGDYIELD